MFASFNQINTDLLLLSGAGIIAVTIYSLRFLPVLDVLSLGRDPAHNLGVDCEQVVGRLMQVVAVLVSIATALVGPITFLGLLIVNIAYQFCQTYRHRILIPAAVLISLIALFGGLLLVERVFTFSTNLTVIMNGIGGSYFLYLMIREGKKC
jgi:iron complex transport system permease protein